VADEATAGEAVAGLETSFAATRVRVFALRGCLLAATTEVLAVGVWAVEAAFGVGRLRNWLRRRGVLGCAAGADVQPGVPASQALAGALPKLSAAMIVVAAAMRRIFDMTSSCHLTDGHG
jgi:hypothetical protein